jgi:hypothetical protein
VIDETSRIPPITLSRCYFFFPFLQLAAIWAVANSAASNAGLDALLSAPDAKSLLAEWLEFAYSSNVELRCGALKSVASIFDRRDDEAALANMEKLYRLLYEGTPTERLLSYLGESLIEIRFASFALLKAIAKHRFVRFDLDFLY